MKRGCCGSSQQQQQQQQLQQLQSAADADLAQSGGNPAKQQKISSQGSASSMMDFSDEDWKIFQDAIVNFASIQREIFQDFILWDLYVEEIPQRNRQLLWDLIQGKLDPSEIYPCNIFTAYIYCSAISLGLESINHPLHVFWSTKAYDLIVRLMSGGGIEQLEHENQKLIIIDHLVKEIYYYIRRSNFWKAKYLYSQANLIYQLTDKNKLIHTPETTVRDLPAFINLHLGTLKIWTMKSIPEKISTLKTLLSDITRVQTGTSVITGLILSCESEEVYNSLMKAASPVPLEPSYADTVWEYLTTIWKEHNISEATAEMQLIFYLSLALLRIRNYDQITLPNSREYLISALHKLLKVKYSDSSTSWYCGIGLSLSILCGESKLMFSFQKEYQRLYGRCSIPWEQKYQLTDKILALSLEPHPPNDDVEDLVKYEED
jgi:hypothetical protein